MQLFFLFLMDVADLRTKGFELSADGVAPDSRSCQAGQLLRGRL